MIDQEFTSWLLNQEKRERRNLCNRVIFKCDRFSFYLFMHTTYKGSCKSEYWLNVKNPKISWNHDLIVVQWLRYRMDKQIVQQLHCCVSLGMKLELP